MRRLGVALLGSLLLSSTATAEPLTLAQAIDSARRNHPDARVARAGELAAKANTGVALAGYLPSIGFSAFGRVDESNFSPVVVGTAGGATDPNYPFQGSYLYQGTLGISQLVFDGGRTLAQLAAARAQYVQAGQDRQTQELALEAAVTASYFAALEADAQLAVAIEYETQLKALFTSVRKMVGAGLKPEVDAISAEARAQRATLDRIRAEGAIQTRRASLLAAIGLDQDPGFSLIDAFTAPLPEEKTPVDELVGSAMKARPEVRSMEAQQRVVEQQIRALRSDYAPSMNLGLAGSLNGSNAHASPLFDFYATLSVQEQFFSGLSTYRGMQVARAQLEAVRAKLAGQRVIVRASVASAHAALDAAAKSDAQAKLLVDQADKLVKSAQKRYDAGLLTLLELSDAQGQRLTALGQRVTAHYAVALSRTDLRRAVGGTILQGEALK